MVNQGRERAVVSKTDMCLKHIVTEATPQPLTNHSWWSEEEQDIFLDIMTGNVTLINSYCIFVCLGILLIHLYRYAYKTMNLLLRR